MRIGVVLGVCAALAAEPGSALEDPHRPSAGPPGCLGETRPDRLEAVTPDGDLVLGSGQQARLSGIRLPDEPYRQQALDRLRADAGQSVLVTVQGRQDRWGRIPVRIRRSGPSQGFDASQGLVDAGLALVDPGSDAVFCRPELLASEETARQRRLGVWAEGRYNPISADRADRLKERFGSFVIVEGRVRSIGERRQRTYLNFGGHWAEDFTIIIPRKTWMLMAERGLSADTLKGRTVRARGILQSWQGTALTIDLPEMIERLEDKSREDTRLAR